MSDAVLSRLFARFFKSSLVGEVVEVLWHAGEPLAAGLPFYRRAFDICKSSTPAGVKAIHSMQTNATLVTREWANFLASEEVNIGVSVDGPEDLHDFHRRTWSGFPTHSKVMQGVRILRAAGVGLAAIAVVTANSLPHAKRFYDFFKTEGFRSLALNVEETESEHRFTTLRLKGCPSGSEDVSRYRAFIDELINCWTRDDNRLRIREFCRYIDRFRELRENTDFFPASDEVTAGGIITVTSDGSVFTYSPELATNRHGHRSYRLGNLDDVADFDEFFAGAAFKAIRAEVEAGVAACKRECHYFNLCGGGSPSNKVSEHGRADVTQTLSCRFHVQEMVEALLENLSKRSMEPTPGNAAESRS